MKILDYRKVASLNDFFNLYSAYLKSEYEKKKASVIISKSQTGLVRYTGPGFGLPLKLDGNLSSAEMLEGLEFMKQIPIYQAKYLLETQEQVFNMLGDRVSPASKRVYRSAVKKMLDWGKQQDWWQQSVEAASDGRTPTMLIFKKRVEHWHKLKPEEISPELNQQLDDFSFFLTKVRQPSLNHSSCIRYRREALGILGWMHRSKGISLTQLSLTDLVPIESIGDRQAAEQVGVLISEYFQWMRTNLGSKESTLRFALQTCLYISEYMQYGKNQKE